MTIVKDQASAAFIACLGHVCSAVGCPEGNPGSPVRQLVASALTYAYTGEEGVYAAGKRYGHIDRDILWEVGMYLKANDRSGDEHFKKRVTHIFRSGSSVV